jgi:ADP-ribose pyrophosphatase YjhB (NUDIX family)
MKLLKKIINSELETLEGIIYKRIAARGIILRDQKILLMYTKYYDDYSLPGGGVDSEEEIVEGLKREISEETGAQEIEVISEYGYIDEYRPYYKEGYDLMHMISYLYICKIKGDLKEAQLEDYEIANGMKARWIDIDKAIQHNKELIASNNSIGQSLERETYLLEKIKNELM